MVAGVARMPTPLLNIALDLSANLAEQDRYDRLVAAIRRIIPCDAAALLQLVGDELVPVASVGLLPDVRGRHFRVSEHPRLARILSSEGPVRFTGADLPDPFDGIIAAEDPVHGGVSASVVDLRVHACLGCVLRVEDEIIGALTFDALNPSAFDQVADDTVATLAALAGAAMRTANLITALEESCRRKGLEAEQLRGEVRLRGGGAIIGHSPGVAALRDEIVMCASSQLTVLITGETGVGKELVARGLHQRSDRASRPLVYVNCAALPGSIAESELFGHIRGAFTGATDARPGRFEVADKGTIFLDEIGELPASVQPKLLRVLQSGELQRVGADRTLNVDVRVVAATNRNLAEEVRLGLFRADLYHRLQVFPIHVPPLRERREDIALLAGFFLDQSRTQLGLGPVHLDPRAREVLERYPWPGNVRELEHVMMRAALRASGGQRRIRVIVGTEHLGLQLRPDGPNGSVVDPGTPCGATIPEMSLGDAVDEFKRQRIRHAVTASSGNWAAAARNLGMDRGNLHRLSRRLALFEEKSQQN